MIRWINNYIGTAAWNDVVSRTDIIILDVRNLVDKEGNDLVEIRKKIDEGLNILNFSDKIVVCCDFGMSRSNSIAAGIIAKKENIDFSEAINIVLSKTDEKEIKISMLDSVQQALGGENISDERKGKTLVTGANGFIGKHLQKIIEQNNNVNEFLFLTSNEIDLTNETVKLNMLCKRENVDKIIHLANPRIYTTSLSFGQAVVMLKNILDVCIQNYIKLIYTSSWEVFSGYISTGLYVTETMKFNPGGTYGQSKMLCENLITHYTEELGLDSIVLRLSPIYGIGSDKPKCVWNFVDKAYNNDEISTHLYLNGLPTIDLLHIEDACTAILKATNFSGIGIFNISYGQPVTTKNLAEDIVDIIKSKSTITHTHLNLMTHNITLDNAKARESLNWKPKRLLNQGLIEIVDYICKK
jgi:nucleoside-diphosphate-sugar epimerase